MVRLSRDVPQIVGVNLARNHGHQLALTAGLSLARGERVFIVDADLQDPPELLTEMMAALDAGADVAYGQRIQRDGETWFKKSSASAFYRLLQRLTDAPIPADTGDFRLMTRQVLDVLMNMPEQHRFVRGMVAWIGFRQVAVPYRRDPRFAGTTKYPLRKMVAFAMDALAVSHVGARIERGHHLRQQFGRVLQIRIDNEDAFAARQRQTGGERQLVAMVARQIDAHDLRHVPRQAHHLGPCSVGRPVIDEYDLVIAARRRRAGGRKPLHKFGKPFFFVVAGHDRGQLFRCCRSQAGKAPRERNAQPGLFLNHEIRPRLAGL
jgi:hypothetical protein